MSSLAFMCLKQSLSEVSDSTTVAIHWSAAIGCPKISFSEQLALRNAPPPNFGKPITVLQWIATVVESDTALSL
jgi:hypothetical protein